MAKTILLVEDEPIVRDSLKDWLSEAGYEVITANDGEEALDIVGQKEFGVAVVDLKLPGKDGIQVIREAKEKTPTLKAIIITAYPSVNTAVDAMKAGATEYLVKPFAPDSLEQLIEEALGGKALVTPEVAVEVKKDEVAKWNEIIAIALKQGVEFFKKGDYKHAIGEFERILTVAPGNLEARIWLRKAKKGVAEGLEEVVVEEAGKLKPCVWMKMGIVSYRICTTDYDCLTCEFDQQMQAADESPEIAAALERLKTLPGNQRLCRFALRGEVSYRLCSRLFQCTNCELYQFMEEETDRKLAKLAVRREALKKKQTKS